MKKVKFDIMYKGRYVCTMTYEFNPLFKFSFEDLFEFIYQKRPSLRNKKIDIYLEDSFIDNFPMKIAKVDSNKELH